MVFRPRFRFIDDQVEKVAVVLRFRAGELWKRMESMHGSRRVALHIRWRNDIPYKMTIEEAAV